mgnify:CR=1 FL=1
MSSMKTTKFRNELAKTLTEEELLDSIATVVATYCVLSGVSECIYMDYFEDNYELAARMNGVVREDPIQLLYGPPGEA